MLYLKMSKLSKLRYYKVYPKILAYLPEKFGKGYDWWLGYEPFINNSKTTPCLYHYMRRPNWIKEGWRFKKA